MIERLDNQILHALQLSPRAPFRRIAEVVGAPEQTVARRYHKMRRDGVVRVFGLVDPRVYGECQWVVRVRAKPDDLPRLAEALVKRPDVTHANVLAGWTELVCIVRAPLGGGSDGLLRRLPRTSAVLGFDIDLILHVFGEPAEAPWTGYKDKLSADQSAQILRWSDGQSPPHQFITPTDDDRALFETLAEDGRVPHSQIADNIGWTPARVKRRIAALEACGTLTYDVDLLPNRLGFNLNAILWLTTSPRHVADVGEQIAIHDEIASVVALSGRNNLSAVAICRDADHLYRYIAERLAAIDHIQSYDVSIRTQRLKQAASLIFHGRLIHPGHT
jgi:DNA-binding Lrp family transcriptional regulator